MCERVSFCVVVGVSFFFFFFFFNFYHMAVCERYNKNRKMATVTLWRLSAASLDNLRAKKAKNKDPESEGATSASGKVGGREAATCQSAGSRRAPGAGGRREGGKEGGEEDLGRGVSQRVYCRAPGLASQLPPILPARSSASQSLGKVLREVGGF